MKITDSSAAKVGGVNVATIASSTALFRQFMVYATTTISSVISGAIGLVKNGTGTLVLNAVNTYTGATTINAGTLKFLANTFNAASRNYTIASGAVLNLDGANVFAAGNSTISGTGKLLITGGTLAGQTSASPTVVGNISLGSGGTIEIASGATIYNGGWVSVYWTSNLADMIVDGTLNVADGRTVIVDALTGSGTIDKTMAGTVTLLVGVDNGNGTFSGIIKNTSGSIALTKNGTGTLTLSGANTYTGGTTVNAGTLQIGNGTNNTARVLGTTTLSGGNLAYNYSNNNNANGAITLTAAATITKLNGFRQLNLQSGTLNGGGQTLNIFVNTTAGTAPLYFNGTAGTSLGQINILNGAAGEDGAFGIPLRNAPINVASGAQFRTYTSPTINNNITLNGGAGPDGNGALWNESVVATHTPIYTGIITLATGTNSSFGNTTSGFTVTGQITGAGSFTKVGTGTLRTFGNNNNYTGSTTISAGTLQVLKASFGSITPTAYFTATTLSVSFSGTFTSGTRNFRFFQGTTTNTYAAVTLTGVPVGTTATYTSATSTLTVIVP